MLKFLLVLALSCGMSVASAANLTLYTDRPADRLKPLAEQFKNQTGVEVTIVELPYKDLLKKLQTEGSESPADMIYTKDLVYQAELAALGFYQPMDSKKVQVSVSSSMRDPRNLWAAVTYRARTLVYDSNRTDVSQINSYEDLAKPEFAGRLCLRTSNNSYNEALVASLIHNLGYERAKNILVGMVENLATDVVKSDTALLESIATGVCEVGLANHYYLAQLIAQKPNFPVSIKFLEQGGRGVHVNGSGIGIAKTSQNPELAQQFVEFLFTDSVQLYISESHFEYPAVQHLVPTSLIKKWGPFKADAANWSDIGLDIQNAKQMVKEIGYL